MKKNTPTIHDISKALGIDSSTVSRALSNSTRVTAKTKDKILKKAIELGYQKNTLASKLRTRKTNTIGVIVPRISRHFFASVISGIEETAYDSGYDVIICQSLDNIEREKQLIQTMHSNRVDGVLVSVSMETNNSAHFNEYKKDGFPIVFFDRPFMLKENINVIIDDYKASFEATEHMIEIGCKEIVHLRGPKTSELYNRRELGYKDALKNNGLDIDDNYILESRLMKEDGFELANKIVSLGNIDGVFAANDTVAISTMQYLKEKGCNIPRDMAFVGFSNEPISAVIEPSLTTVRQADVEMGKVASLLLFELIKNNTNKINNQVTILEPNLIIRNSTSKFINKLNHF